MNVLIITDGIRQPPQSGGEIRHLQCYQAIQNYAKVDVIAFQTLEGESTDNTAQNTDHFDRCRRRIFHLKSLLNVPEVDRSRYQSFFGRMILTLGSVIPYEYRTSINHEISQSIKHLCKENDYDAIWISCTKIAVSLKGLPRSIVIVDGDDFDSVREYYLLKNSDWYGAKIFNYINLLKLCVWEWILPRLFRFVIRCSEQDRSRVPHRNVYVVPNGTLPPPPLFQKNLSIVPTILFVGMLGYTPNRQGMEWFLRNVWCKIIQSIPEARLEIVGNGASQTILSYNGIQGVSVRGFQEDLLPFYQSAWLSIAPLLSGAGTRLKILEALAHRTPVVSTPVGAYGIDIHENHGLILAKSSDEFADRCVQLLRSPSRISQLGDLGHNQVLRSYSWETSGRKIQALLSSQFSENCS